MGAEFCFKAIGSKMTGKEAVVAAEKVIAEACYMHGHGGYTGSFAEALGAELPKTMPVIEDAEKAYEWLDSNTEKWEAALVIHDKAGNWYMGALCSS
jgi:hypothetical protein